MSDVARLAGVGTMTVSRVLSGTVRVSADTAQRVLTAIEQLKYRPNVLARAFRGQRSHSIGLIVPYLYDPFFASCCHAVTTVAKEHGYSVIITTSGEDPEIEYAAADEMLQRHVDGLLVIPCKLRQTRISRSLVGKTPVVAFDRPVPDASIDTVLVQNSIGARRMVEHLIEHGHKHITYIALSRSLFTINARFLGYRRAMQDAGLESCAIFDCASEEEAAEILKTKLCGDARPTAILTSNTLATRYVLGGIARLGLRIPNDLALAGFDDFDLAEFTSPPLTVVRQPAQEMGRVAASLLFDRITRGETPHTGNRIVLPVEIVLRRSCGCKHRTPVVIH
ncbi:MAG: LacI family DNA-binding transcriptional regulator [Terracidiphilus sp.]|jgi:LacI family transcriptional regulator